VTSESQSALGPNEHHLLHIDPFYLDRRNFDPDQLLTGSSNNPRHGQEPDAEAPSAVASLPEFQTHVENNFHSFASTSPNPPQSLQHAVTRAPQNNFHSFASTSANSPQALQHAVTRAPGSTKSILTCPSCLRTFRKPYLLNQHSKSHTRDFKCAVPGCPDRGSRYRKDLVRHMQSMHPEVEGFKGFHCPIAGCSRSVGKEFFRKDNFLRHMRTQHPHVPGGPSA